MHRRRLFVLKRHIMAIEKKIMGRGLRRKRSIMEMKFFWGLMLPLIGTAAGSACVFFLKNKINPLVQKGLLGFASGVMVAASVWSLLIPAMDMAEGMGRFAFVPAAVGLLLGFGFLLFMDRMIPHLHIGAEKSEGPKTSLKKNDNACPCGNAAQYSGGHGGRRYFCGRAGGKYGDYAGRGVCAGGRDRDPEFPGRGDHFDALKK